MAPVGYRRRLGTIKRSKSNKKKNKKRGRLFLLKNSGINLRILGKQKEWPPQIHFRTPAGLSKWMNAFTQQLFVCLFVCFISRNPRLKEAVLTEILETSGFLYLLPNTSEMSILPLQEWRVYKHVTHAITPPPPLFLNYSPLHCRIRTNSCEIPLFTGF